MVIVVVVSARGRLTSWLPLNDHLPSFGGRDTCIIISITSQLLFIRYCSNAIMAGNGLVSNIHSMLIFTQPRGRTKGQKTFFWVKIRFNSCIIINQSQMRPSEKITKQLTVKKKKNTNIYLLEIKNMVKKNVRINPSSEPLCILT